MQVNFTQQTLITHAHPISAVALYATLLNLLFSIIFLPQAYADTINAAELYQNYCSVCHGDQGNGKSHAQQGLVPPPRDFTSPRSSIELSRERIIHAIKEGVPGSAMIAWKSKLSDQQIHLLSDYIRQTFLRPATVKSATEGSQIYADYCSVCHGDTGQGAVWATAGLRPRPVDFTDARQQAALNRPRMIKSVAYGRAETAMTGWKNRLSDRQIEVVVDYVINTFMTSNRSANSRKTKHVATAENTHADMTLPMPDGLKGNYTRGATLYMSNCSTCHGESGDGRGPRAYFINPKPRNFLHTSSRASFNRPSLYRAVKKGKLRTEMPAWEKVFEPQQLADVSEYVFKQFIENK